MNKKFFLLFFIIVCSSFSKKADNTYIDRQGKITFFSYTPVENIQATNTSVLSILNADNGEIAVEVLMRTFEFKKTLMYEHFNESYIESDLYPKAILQGNIVDFDSNAQNQTKFVKGNFTLRGITKPVEIKVNIVKTNDYYLINGELEVQINDHDIRVPKVLSANIAKKIQVSFNFQYESYEN